MTVPLCRNAVKTKPCHWFAKRFLNVLGIESSCDETSTAVVSDSGKILGEGHFSQSRIHLEAGGVLPIIAYNLHNQFLKSMVEISMKQSLLDFKDLDAIAVTVKPGLSLPLKAGLKYAKDLCTTHSRPLIPIHHMEAHALTARLIEDVKFPFLTLLISGGHCILGVAESVDKFKTLGSSTEKTPGQVFDKIARRAKLKNLKEFKGLVGGAAIEAAAVGGDSSVFNCKKMYALNNKSCNFSFSPVMTMATRYLASEEIKHSLGPDEVIPNIKDLCAGILLSVARHVCHNLEIAFHYVNTTELLKDSEKCLVMSGGVASNRFICKAVKRVCDHYGYKFVVPPAKLCSDNGVMIAWNGIERLRENLPVIHHDNLSSVTELTRCPFGEDISRDVEENAKKMSFKFMKLDSYSEIAMAKD